MKHDLIIYCSREISEFLFCYRISVFRRIIGKSLLFPSLQLAPPQSLHDHHQASFVPVDRAWQPLPHSLPSPGTVDVLFGPNLTHQTMSMKKTKQPNSPHFLYSTQLFQTTQVGNHCLILQTALNPHTGLTNAWDAMVQRLQVIEDGLKLPFPYDCMRVHRPRGRETPPPKKKNRPFKTQYIFS